MSLSKKEHRKRLLAIYTELYPTLCLQGKVMGYGESQTRDIIQDIFLELLEKRQMFNNIIHYKSYLSTTLRRRVSKEKKRNFVDYDEQMNNWQTSYETLLISSQAEEEKSKRLQDSLKKLTTKQKLIIKLRFFDGLSYEEIAESEQISIRTVYNQFHTAIKILRKETIF